MLDALFLKFSSHALGTGSSTLTDLDRMSLRTAGHHIGHNKTKDNSNATSSSPVISSAPPFRSTVSLLHRYAMRPLSCSISDKSKESFARKRDDPYFDGMRRVDPDFITQGLAFLSQGTFSDRNSVASSSISDDSYHKQILVEPSEHVSDQRSKQSVSSVHLLETYERTLSGRLSKFVGAPLFSFPTMPSDSESNMDEPSSMLKDSMPRDYEADDEFYSITVVTKPIAEKRYSLNQRKSDLSKVSLPQSAASFYCGHSPQIEIIESCESIVKLNCYLATRRDDIRAGVPGMYLHAVIGPEFTGNSSYL
ncbi:hypothetical protein Sjap_005148 [Stephania japonica]|uniref:Uncharacterized protein n=1 Tax=Stephania japonica TaxID=461633 RepID=A0AAP0K5X2_9MAGN